MIYEDILACAKKVEGIGKFFYHLTDGDLRHSREDFYLDVGAMLVREAEQIKRHCDELAEVEKGGADE